MMIIATVFIYFCILLLFSKCTTRKSNNESFYRANRRSPWYLVAFGMIGASISGVTFVSVPGMVGRLDMTYIQTCLGFILGYFAVAFLLLPVYYRLNLTTIYTYLKTRLGERSYKTGAGFFLLSKMTGAAVRFYVVCMILQQFVLNAMGIPFPVTVLLLVALIWLYTRRGGIKTLVWTDTFQTICMFAALILIIGQVISALGMTVPQAVTAIVDDRHSKIFVFDDWMSTQNFWKQFLSGIFIVIVMTGLDQDMMQKNLTCKTLREAQKDMCSYGFAFVPANLLFLSLGVLLLILAKREGIQMPDSGDGLLPMFAATGRLGNIVVVLFSIGIVAASFSSADSALTALTTSYCVDIRERQEDERLRKRAHLGICILFVVFILLFRVINSTSLIDAIYILCSYTYGPLLGLFAFGLLTRRRANDRLVPYIAVASPLICWIIDDAISRLTGYRFGYELLMLNGALTFVGLALSSSTLKR
ncbi:MAG: sodium:solute symporter [Prevotella sp.]|jgi:Na+/proline symporter|nr:sodium:solute symporter [Prevotella sp.]MCI2081371.1 sodium:solute symporter [Prevotella sp.]MCI2103243.1 sodium:solute symporter [Prevotella sp.]